MNVLNLNFFDREGKPLNFEYNIDEARWEGVMYFDPLSIGLFDNQHIFITELIDTVHAHPILTDTYDTSPGLDILTFNMEESENNEFFPYEVIVDDSLSLPFLSKLDLVIIDNIPDIVRIPAQVNIAFNPSAEEVTEMVLIGKYAGIEVIRIQLYGEGIDEDERMLIWAKNFGIKFNKEDALILKDYDLVESLPDWEVINNKRKELVLTKEEVFPYIGTYRGLINMIDLFGFKDTLEVKEYWLNVDKTSPYYNKYFLTDIVNMVSTGQIQTVKLMQKDRDIKFSNAFQKTGFLSLVYSFTKETGEYDDIGLPVVESTTEFTQKDIFYKMNRLSDKLKDEFLPVNVAIKDVIGQYVYYTAFIFNTWNDTVIIYNTSLNEYANIIAHQEFNYGIRDLSVFNEQTNINGVFFPQESINDSGILPYQDAQMYPIESLPAIITAIDAYYDLFTSTSHYTIDNSMNWENNYLTEAKSGCPVIFELVVQEMQIDDFRSMQIDDFVVSNELLAYYTWENIKYRDIYEIEWNVRKGGPNSFDFKRRLLVKDFYKLPIFLPYAGTYDISVVLYDLLGGTSRKFKMSFTVVDSIEPQIMALTKVPDIYSTIIKDYQFVKVEDLEDSYAYNIFPNFIRDEDAFTRLDPILMDWNFYRNSMGYAMVYNDEIDIPAYESFATTTYSKKKYFGVNDYAYCFNMYSKSTISELEFLRPIDTMFHGQTLAGFIFQNPNPGDIIRFTRTNLLVDEHGYTDYVIPELSPFTLDNLIIALNASDHAAIKLFTYQVINGKIQAAGKDYGNEAYQIVEFIDNSIYSPSSPSSPSEGLISGNLFTFNFPYWLYNEDTMNELKIDYPGFDIESMFLFAPMHDRLRGYTDIADYWVSNHSIEIQDDIQRGHLPSIVDANFLTMGNIKAFDSTFTIPKFAYVVFTVNNIVSKKNFVWKIYKTGETIPYFTVKDVPFLMWVFSEIGSFDIEVSFTDFNGNLSITKVDNYVKVITAEDYKNYAKDWLVTRAYKRNK